MSAEKAAEEEGQTTPRSAQIGGVLEGFFPHQYTYGSCKPLAACIQGWFANIQGSKRRSKLLPRVMFQHPRVEPLLIFQALVGTLKMWLPSKAAESWLDKDRKTGMAGFWQVIGVILQAGCLETWTG